MAPASLQRSSSSRLSRTLNIVRVLFESLFYFGILLLLLPLLIPLLFGCFVYRWCLKISIQRRLGESVKLMSGVDNIFSHDTEHNHIINNALFLMEGILDPERCCQSLQENMLSLKEEDGTPRYFRLQQYMHEEGGYYFWREEKDFNVKKHVELYNGPPINNDEDVKVLLSRVCSDSFPQGLSPWGFLIVHLYNFKGIDIDCTVTPHTCIILRMHHGLADGISILRFLMLCMLDGSEANMQLSMPPTKNQRLGHLSNVLTFLWIWLQVPRAFIKQFFPTEPHILHGPPLNGKKIISYSLPFPLETVKRVKRNLGITVNEVILTCIAASFRKHFIITGAKMPAELPSIIPLSLHSITDKFKLGNNTAVVGFDLPLAPGSPMERIQAIKLGCEKLRHSADLVANYYGFKFLLNLLPKAITSSVFNAAPQTCIISNVPGVQSVITAFGGMTGKRGFFLLPHRGKIGIGVSILSACGVMEIAFSVDSALIDNQQQVDLLVENFMTELHDLDTYSNCVEDRAIL